MRIRLRAVGVLASFTTARRSASRRAWIGLPPLRCQVLISAYGAGYWSFLALRATCLTICGASSVRASQVLVAHAVARCLNGRVVPDSASATAVSSTTAGATTLSTRPMPRAAEADRVRPVSIMSIAAGAPTSCGRRALPPHPGKMPSWVSGRPMRVLLSLEATR